MFLCLSRLGLRPHALIDPLVLVTNIYRDACPEQGRLCSRWFLQSDAAGAGLFPEFEHFEAFAGKALISDFSELIERFGQEARLDGTYFFCRQSSVLALAKLLQPLDKLSLKV